MFLLEKKIIYFILSVTKAMVPNKTKLTKKINAIFFEKIKNFLSRKKSQKNLFRKFCQEKKYIFGLKMHFQKNTFFWVLTERSIWLIFRFEVLQKLSKIYSISRISFGEFGKFVGSKKVRLWRGQRERSPTFRFHKLKETLGGDVKTVWVKEVKVKV